MTDFTIRVVAPSRLHFGLLSFGHDEGRQFGGVGVMIDEPSITLVLTSSSNLEASGLHVDRVLRFAQHWIDFQSLEKEPPCHLRVESAPQQHIGLGLGTQLGLSVAAGLNAWLGWTIPSPAELAISVGRGLRSAVGTYGFAQGGLIAEGGKLPRERISPLDCGLDIPDSWRFVLICPRAGAGLSGDGERKAFDELPSSPQVTEQLRREARENLLPALAQTDFERFSESLFRYGTMSGACFSSQQGGPFNGPLLTEIVDTIRCFGVRGVGQSSWGPTIYCVLPSESHATELSSKLAKRYPPEEFEVWISRPNNQGAKISCTGDRVEGVPQREPIASAEVYQ